MNTYITCPNCKGTLNLNVEFGIEPTKPEPEEKWAKEKEAFARGEKIQSLNTGILGAVWKDVVGVGTPTWSDNFAWRIAPKKKWIWARAGNDSDWAISDDYLTEDEAKEFGWTHKLIFTEIEE